MKPTLYEFLHAYMHNLYDTLVDQGFSIEGLGVQCCCCPFREACEAMSEHDSDIGCAEFIKSMLIDGENYR